MKKKFKAMVLSCMDPRFQFSVHKFLKKKGLTDQHSSFTIAGGSIGVTHLKFKRWHSTFLDNLSTSIKLHKIEKLIVINHEDCGAIKIAEPNSVSDENEIHENSFEKLKTLINKKFPKLKLEFYIMGLNKRTKNI